jgi:hypothetical protein
MGRMSALWRRLRRLGLIAVIGVVIVVVTVAVVLTQLVRSVACLAGVGARQGFAYLVRVRDEAPKMRGYHYASRVTAVPHLGVQATAIFATAGFPDTTTYCNQG